MAELGMRVVSAAVVKTALQGLGYPALIQAMEVAFKEFSSKQVDQPVRGVTNVAPVDGYFGTMPAYSPAAGLGIKMVSFFPQNNPSQVPTHQAIIALFDPQTGTPKVLMDGEHITEWRTAAASAAATKLFANGFDKLTILGAGVQAQSHALALAAVTDSWKEICIWNRNAARGQKLVEALQAAGVAAEAVTFEADLDTAVTNSDVIVTATSASEPVLGRSNLKSGVHINAVGACRPTWRELDDSIMQASKVFVDSRDAAIVESGDIILSKCQIEAEVGEVLEQQSEQQYRSEMTVFKSLGMAIEDVIAAKLVQDWIETHD
eukprot:m.146164 g.146164  ORF g.146164 m.146164 type:complete len:320 (+) comp16231_c0_seq2:1457-2416(+)